MSKTLDRLYLLEKIVQYTADIYEHVESKDIDSFWFYKALFELCLLNDELRELMQSYKQQDWAELLGFTDSLLGLNNAVIIL